MKTPDHYSKGEKLEQQQASLDAAAYSETIISICHGAAHHFVCAGLEWAGMNHEQHGHMHGKHPTLLKQAKAPATVRTAWDDLEHLRTKAFYGSGTNSAAVIEARTYLATIKEWAKSIRL